MDERSYKASFKGLKAEKVDQLLSKCKYQCFLLGKRGCCDYIFKELDSIYPVLKWRLNHGQESLLTILIYAFYLGEIYGKQQDRKRRAGMGKPKKQHY